MNRNTNSLIFWMLREKLCVRFLGFLYIHPYVKALAGIAVTDVFEALSINRVSARSFRVAEFGLLLQFFQEEVN